MIWDEIMNWDRVAKILSLERLLRNVKPRNIIKQEFCIGRDMRDVESDIVIKPMVIIQKFLYGVHYALVMWVWANHLASWGPILIYWMRRLGWGWNYLAPCYSKYGTWTNSMRITLVLVRNVETQTSPQTYQVRICILTRPSDELIHCFSSLFFAPHTTPRYYPYHHRPPLWMGNLKAELAVRIFFKLW